jgi:hypothetical protein
VCETRFAGETLGEFGLRNFHRDNAVEPFVPRLIHFAHAARTDWRNDFIRAKTIPG